MKKFIVSAAMLSAFMLAGAQVLTVKSIHQVSTPESLIAGEAVISGDGSTVIIGDVSSTAIRSLNLASGDTRQVTDNGSMLDLKVSADGQKVVYRQRTVDKNRLVQTGLKATDVATGKTVEVAKPGRNFNGFALDGNGVVTSASVDGTKTRTKTKSLNGSKSVQSPVVGINRGHLVLTVDGRQSVIDPQGNGSYLWPSLSPDGTKILYYKAQAGCFVCNLDGSDPVELGYIHAPKWYGNDVVIGMQDFDNGTYITESAIVAAKIGGEIQKLTDDSIVALYPSGAPEAGKIVFTDPMGKLYLITVE